MPDLDNRLGVCSWSLKPSDPNDLIEKVQQTGVKAVQLALGPMRKEPDTWDRVVQTLQQANVRILSGMFGTVGEDYSSLESIARTGGIVPDEHWHENQTIVEGVARIAAAENISTVSFHAGFIPEDPGDPGYGKLLERVRWIADRFAQDNIDVLFETGQETADDLLAFMGALDRSNVGVNFDPANMILYGKGDPIEALRKLLPHTRQVHIKDARSSDQPGKTWGSEVAVGDGAVDWSAFMSTLEDGNFTGPLTIEREAGDQRVADIKRAVDHLYQLAT